VSMEKTLVSNLCFNAFDHAVLAPFVYQMPVSRPASFAEFDAARQAIEELAFPESDWDGYGALPITAEAKTNARAALDTLETSAPAPEVIPNANGTLSFEWETDLGVGHLEIGRTRYSFYIRPRVGAVHLDDGPAGDVGRFLGFYIDGLLYRKPLDPAFRTTNV
jgi:hypothetical protein